MPGKPVDPAPAQQALPFGAAEGSHSERRQRLLIALQVLRSRHARRVDLHLKEFVLLVFHLTPAGPLVRSYEELAGTALLCCSVPKVRRTVQLARHMGLVKVTERFSMSAQLPNAYEIDWARVSQIRTGESSAAAETSARQTAGGGDLPDQGGDLPDQGGDLPDHAVLPFSCPYELPPSPPRPTPRAETSAADVTAFAVTWEVVVEVFRSVGVNAAWPMVKAARKAGWTPAGALACARVYQRHPDRWDNGPAALYYRVACGDPHRPADDLAAWFDPSAAHVAKARAAAVETARLNRDQAAADLAALRRGDQARALDQDAALRRRLESLPPDQLDALAAEAAADVPWFALAWPRDRLESFACRCELARRLDAAGVMPRAISCPSESSP